MLVSFFLLRRYCVGLRCAIQKAINQIYVEMILSTVANYNLLQLIELELENCWSMHLIQRI